MKNMNNIFIICALLIATAGHVADASASSDRRDTEEMRHGPVILLPECISDNENEASKRLSELNDYLDQTTITDVSFGDHGGGSLIDEVRYSNGSVARYSYEMTDDDMIKSIKINIDDEVEISFVVKRLARESGSEYEGGQDEVVIEVRALGGTGKSMPEKDVKKGERAAESFYATRVHRADIDLKDLAQKPIKFNIKEIRESLQKAQEARKDALSTFEKKTAPYYTQVAQAIMSQAKKLSEVGIDISQDLRSMGDGECQSAECRKAVDDAVRIIRDGAQVDISRTRSLGSILVLEEGLRGDILKPEMEAYDKRMEAALKYVNSMIDNLLSSELAVYMKSKKEKIDVVIKLPKQKNTSKE